MGLQVFFNPMTGNIDMSPSLITKNMQFSSWFADVVKPSPQIVSEYGEQVYLFGGQGDYNAINGRLKVMADYFSGQLLMRLAFYAPPVAGVAAFKVTTILKRQGADISDASLTNTWLSGDIDFSVAPVANKVRKIEAFLTDGVGKIGGTAIRGDDIIDITFERIAPVGIDVADSVRVIPTCEILKT